MRTWRFVSLVSTGLLLSACGRNQWHDAARASRMPVRVSANGFERVDTPVMVTGEFSASVRIVELDSRGSVVHENVAHQVDQGARLTFLMPGVTAPDQTRFFYVYLGEGDSLPAERQVTVEDRVIHQEQESFKITTPVGTWVYHQKGAGFASLIDKTGNDWISYRPIGGSDGKYRGISNMIHPEGGFHPGTETCASDLVSRGPLVASIRSECHEGKWSGEWDIFPGHARFTLLKADHPYWFLYEGTPGGKLDPDSDYWAQADGTKLGVSETWSGRLALPRWVYFGDSALKRVLFLVHHEDDGNFDQFWQMEGNMTVFGFGRQLRCCEKSLKLAPARFTVGLLETADHRDVTRLVNGAYRDLIVSKGAVERRP